MTERIHHGPIAEPAAALAVVAAAMARLGVAADERAGLLASVARGVRDHHPGGWLTLSVTDEPRLRATVSGDGAPDRTGTARIGAGADPVSGGETALLDLIIDQYDTLGRHRRELERTDQGVLALHAELAETTERLRQASDLQRRFLDAERAAHAAAEASRARLAFLAHAGATLAESLDHEQILGRLHTIVVPRHASAMTVWLVREPGTLDAFPAEDEPQRPHPLIEKAFASGRAQHATREWSAQETAPGVDTTVDRQQILAIPLISRGGTLGVLAAEPPAGSFGAEDVAAFIELARLTAAATDNALRYEHEHDIAQLLQRAMLTRLPAGGRLELTARYLPAEAGLNVGGDWYDAFARPDGDMMAVVGDVTGHGAFTHMSMYQAAIALRDLRGEGGPSAEYHAVPHTTFTDPEVGGVGLTEAAARDRGLDVRVGQADLGASSRGFTHGPGAIGLVKVVEADGVLVGASVVGPAGGEILAMLTLAVHARIPVATLRTMIYAYPTFHRTIESALADLDA